MRRLLQKLIRNEHGIALPTVIGALTITTGLAAGTFAVTIQGNHASQRDRDVKVALGAAEAGLQMASLKVSELGNIPVTKCVTTAAVDPVGTECPSTGWIDMGNGARYQYVVTPPGATQQCASLTATSAYDRCITSIGEVNGVKRRLQMRFAYQAPLLPWGNAGLVGKDKIEIGNNKVINSTVGTNGNVHLENNARVIGQLLLPDGVPSGAKGSATIDNNAEATQGVADVPEWTFPDIPWTPVPREVNNNDLLNGVPGWNATTKVLTPPNQGTIDLTLASRIDADGVTDFHLCKLDASGANDIEILIPNGKITRFWIDSNRGTSGSAQPCPGVSDDGTFVIKNGAAINAELEPDGLNNPAELEVYLYGSSSDSVDDPDVDWNNNVEFYGSIWAPNSTVDVWNNQGVAGAITAKNVILKNNGGFVHDNRVRDKALPGTAVAKNLSWFECTSEPTVSGDPESGCG